MCPRNEARVQCTPLAVPDLGKPGYCPGKILVNCGYCLRKLVVTLPCVSPARVTLPCVSPARVTWQVWNPQWCTRDWYKVSWSLFVKTVVFWVEWGYSVSKTLCAVGEEYRETVSHCMPLAKYSTTATWKLCHQMLQLDFYVGFFLSFSPEGYQLWNLISSWNIQWKSLLQILMYLCKHKCTI